MPRFFFNCEGAQTFSDADGTELPDLRTARLQAIEQAGEILRDHAESFEQTGWWRMTISDTAERTLSVLKFEVSYAPGTD